MTKPGLWDDADVISVYSRAMALEDGEIIDISKMAREAGFKMPFAVSRSVFSILEPSDALKAEGQDFKGRTWDMLTILRHAIKIVGRTDRVNFSTNLILSPGKRPETVPLYAVCGPGDEGEPVITVMRVGED